ncbi:MAG: gamma-glutamyltransferase family protein, partial [bacterium]|nr:gamma-glutamyltransferase family protein [bacterium]
ENLHKRGLTEMPKFGFEPVTVPGAIKGWSALSKRFGRLPFESLFTDILSLARNGFPVGETTASYWAKAATSYKNVLKEDYFKHWFDTFLFDGLSPVAGQVITLLDHASTLEEIASTHGESFYSGALADQIDAFSRKHNGFIRKADLENYQVEWVEPISVHYKGYDVFELPPNGQGIVALEALGILSHLALDHLDGVLSIHHQIESLKLAFSDAFAYVSDPKSISLDLSNLLDPTYISSRASSIGFEAIPPHPGTPNRGGTVYFATADKDGNMVSFIQSNYMGFGSGLVVPHTGIALHNRGHNFSMVPNHPNCVQPHKRPYHTIIPGFLSKDNIPLGPFGVMGGFMQPQGHVQVLSSMIDFHLNPQAALDKPRFQWMKDLQVIVEPDFNKEVITELLKRGHQIQIEPELGQFGRGQIILRNPQSKVYTVGTEKRADGYIAAY